MENDSQGTGQVKPLPFVGCQMNNIHGTRRNGKALKCYLCGVMASKDPSKATKHQKQCPVAKYKGDSALKS